VIVPDVGTFLLLLAPSQTLVPESIVRLGMLAGALVLPGIIGAATLALDRKLQRSPRRILTAVARGYPLTALIALLLVFLAGLAVWRKASSLARRRTDAHVPIVVTAGAYDQVARDLDHAISAAGIEVAAGPAPASMSTPARWLAKVAGRDASNLVPDRLIQLHGPDLDVLIYPMDLLITGKREAVARARAAMASRLTTTAAHLTVSAESQAIEDRLTALSKPAGPDGAEPSRYDERVAGELDSIDEVLATITVPYDEWEVLYRQRLQVERNLRKAAMTADDDSSDQPGDGDERVAAVAGTLGRWIRVAGTALLEGVESERA
jgi:hypothetical protein